MSLLPVPELIKLIKQLCNHGEFDEVQNILLDREKKVKIEMENLERDRDSIKKELQLLEKTQLDKLNFEETLIKSQKQCEELNEKNKIITDLKNRILEKDQNLGVYEEKFKNLDKKVAQMDRDVLKLKKCKLEADRTVEKLRRQQMEADQMVQKLRRLKLDADKAYEIQNNLYDQVIDEMARQMDAHQNKAEPRRHNLKASQALKGSTQKNIEAYKAADLFKKMNENLYEARIDELATPVIFVDRDLPQSSWMNQGSNTNNVNGILTPPGLQSGYNPLQAENNGKGQENGSKKSQEQDRRASPCLEFKISAKEQRMIESWCSNELKPISADPETMIEVTDSEDEDEINCPKLFSSPCSRTQRENGTDCEAEVSQINHKRKRRELESEDSTSMQ